MGISTSLKQINAWTLKENKKEIQEEEASDEHNGWLE